MAATLNLHRVFAGRGGYLEDLKVQEDDAAELREAREEIRAVLRSAFRDWQRYVARTDLFEATFAKSLAEPKLPQPKFRLQGSFAYHTVNDVQQNPPQQVDQDDGVFLPIGFLASNGGRPTIVSQAYFKLVEDALRPLCIRKTWALNPGRARDTCVRIEINSTCHIDLPLYAIRDEAFDRLEEAVLARSVADMATDGASELFDEVYRGLTSNEIMLAHRTEGWIGSDPRKLEDWFKSAIELYGDQVRRLARAYKGMRDAEWAQSNLRSICIMAAVVTALENIGRQEETRDDLALLNTAREMAKVFRESIENPVYPGDHTKLLCEGWTQEFRDEVCALFDRAANELDLAINGTMHKQVALNHAKAAFGPRIPDDTHLITYIGLANVIRSEQPEPQPRPMPIRTKSG